MPVASGQFAVELARGPPGVARDHAEVGRFFRVDQVAQDLCAARDVDPTEDSIGVLGCVVGEEEHEQALRRNRSADKDRIGRRLQTLELG